MKLIKDFRAFLSDSVLLELSSNSTLYHRSPIKLKVGDRIQSRKNKDGRHWLQDSLVEIALEEFRKRNFPNRPSRFNAIYTTPYPRSRFVDKGYLYAVQPVGEVFMTDSMLIDEINDYFSRSLSDLDFDEQGDIRSRVLSGDKNAVDEIVYMLPYSEAGLYWRGILNRPVSMRKNIEVLCEGAIVTEIINDNRLKNGDVIKIESDGLIAKMDLFINSKSSKIEMTKEESDDFLDQIKKEIFTDDVKITQMSHAKPGKGINGSDEYFYRIIGQLRPGSKLKISYVQSSIYNKHDEIHTKYSNIMFDFYLGKTLYQRNDNKPPFRLETSYIDNKGVYDMSKFFKK